MAENGAAAAAAAGGNKLFVGNLSWDTTDEGLKNHFAEAKDVVSAAVMRHDGRSRGWGLVEFSSAAAAEAAINKLNGTTLDGRPILVKVDAPRPAREAREPREPRANPAQERAPRPPRVPRQPREDDNNNLEVARRCYVGNLSWRTSWQDLKDHFATIGPVVFTDVIKSPDGRSKGFGIVEFEKREDAVRAINEMNETELGGRQIYVRVDKKDRELQPQ
eukprot:m.23600 g.23600  ORF g.23600 m.23600 type:complete len:219 (-) comp11071_c0_seq2:39-695(-)